MLSALGNITDSLLNPVIIQLIIAVATVAAVIVSFFSAQRRSETAAARLTFEISERQNHSLTLVDEPRSHIRPGMTAPDRALIVNAYYPRGHPRLETLSSDFKARINKEPNKKFLLSHLQTGYPEIYSALEEFDKEFNRISSEVLDFYQGQVKRLQELWVAWDLQLFPVDYYGVVQALSEDFSNVKRGSDPQIIAADVTGGGFNLRYGSRTVLSGKAEPSSTTSHLARALEDFRDDAEFKKKWEEYYSQASKIFVNAEKIEDSLNLIQAYVRAGNFIKGSCEAGIDAGYEKKPKNAS